MVPTLAIGLGLFAAVASVTDAIVLRPLALPEADDLVIVDHDVPGLPVGRLGNSSGSYLVYRDRSRAFESLAAYHENAVTITAGRDPQRVSVAVVTPSLFETLKARPHLGRLFAEQDGDDVFASSVVISYELWVNAFGADSSLIDQTVEINGIRKKIHGVLESTIRFPRRETDIWYPLGVDYGDADLESFPLTVLGRVRSGTSVDMAQRDLAQLTDVLAETFGPERSAWLTQARWAPAVRPLKDVVIGDLGVRLWILSVAMLALLMIAAANATGLALVRAENRLGEVRIRRALGAGATQLGRLFLLEASVVGAVAYVTALGLAWLGLTLFMSLGPTTLPRLDEVGLTPRVAIVTAIIAVFSALVLTTVGVSGLRSESVLNLRAAVIGRWVRSTDREHATH